MKNFLFGLVIGANWRAVAAIVVAVVLTAVVASIEFIEGFVSVFNL